MTLKLPGLVPIDYLWQSPLRRVPAPPKTRTVILSAGAKARLARIVRRAPETVVKVKGRTRGAEHLRAHLRYIGRRGTVELHSHDGLVHRGGEAIDGIVADWSSDLRLAPARGRRPETISQGMILSMPPGTDPQAVLAAAKSFSDRQFHNHDWLIALHTDEKHPHTHLAVRVRGRDGRQLRIAREDLQSLRERFAEALRERGVMAEATPRRTRGVSRRATRAAQHHIGKRGQAPERWRDATREVLQAMEEGDQAVTPWTKAMRDRQATHRVLLVAAAEELGRSGAADDRALAADVQRYAESLPEVMTRGEMLTAMLREEAQRRHDEAGGDELGPLPGPPRRPERSR